MIEGTTEPNTSSTKKYWLVLLSAILIAAGVGGITYLTLMKTNDIVTNTAASQTPTPAQSEVKQLENDEKAVTAELNGIEQEINDINVNDASLDDAPAL